MCLCKKQVEGCVRTYVRTSKFVAYTDITHQRISVTVEIIKFCGKHLI